MNDKTDLAHPKTLKEYLRLYFSGFVMGSAEIVPGVSGGTMAFVLGVYETLINAIKSADLTSLRMAMKFDIKGILEYMPIRFLLALGFGMITAILMLASLIDGWLHNETTFLFAFFGGLIVASIIAVGAKVKWVPNAIIVFVIGAMFAFFLVGFEVEEETATNTGTTQEIVEEDEYVASPPLTLFFSGMIAICAMILPGISGSFILLILGQYEAAVGAVKNLDIVSIMALGAGAAIGIIAFSRILSWLLDKYKNVTIAALVGFMLGSLRLIWTRAVHGVDVISESGVLDGEQAVLVISLLIAGFVLVSLIDHLQDKDNPVFVLFWKPDVAPTVE